MTATGCPPLKLAERLPGGINRVTAKDQMQGSKLPIDVHEHLKLKYKIQVSHVHNFEIWLEPFAFSIEIIQDPVST